MPEGFVNKPFPEALRAEVKGMFLAEYNEAEKLALVRDNAWSDGQTEGVFDPLVSPVKKNLPGTKDAAEQAGVSESAFKQRLTAK